jgi:hypothetical protein
MKRWKRLAIFTAVILLLLGEYVGLTRHYFNIVMKYEEANSAELENTKLELVISLFYFHYHKWPGPPGPITDQAVLELMGLPEATINIDHINFFKKADCPLPTGNLYFESDDTSGTCRVHGAIQAANSR